MPRKKKSSAQKTKEFQEGEFPARIKAQRAKNVKVVDLAETVGRPPITKRQRARAQASERALSRAEKRMGKKDTAFKAKKAKPLSRTAALSGLVRDAKNLAAKAAERLEQF